MKAGCGRESQVEDRKGTWESTRKQKAQLGGYCAVETSCCRERVFAGPESRYGWMGTLWEYAADGSDLLVECRTRMDFGEGNSLQFAVILVWLPRGHEKTIRARL